MAKREGPIQWLRRNISDTPRPSRVKAQEVKQPVRHVKNHAPDCTGEHCTRCNYCLDKNMYFANGDRSTPYCWKCIRVVMSRGRNR